MLVDCFEEVLDDPVRWFIPMLSREREDAVLPQAGALTGDTPKLGVLHDQLESLPPVVVGRIGREGALPPFYGVVNLEVDMEWTTEVSRPGSPQVGGGSGR